MLRPKAASENLVEKVFGVVQVHFDFFEDDLALLLDVFRIEFGAEDEVGNHVEGDGEMLIEDFGVEADLLFGSKGVEHAADGIHFAGDGFGGAALGALKDHVLHEVGEAVFLGDLAAGTIADPDANRDGADVRHGLGDDHQAVGEEVLLDVAGLIRHKRIVTQPGGKENEKDQININYCIST